MCVLNPLNAHTHGDTVNFLWVSHEVLIDLLKVGPQIKDNTIVLFSEAANRCTASYPVKIIWCSCLLCNPPPSFIVWGRIYFFCDRRRVAVTRHRMICLCIIFISSSFLFQLMVIGPTGQNILIVQRNVTEGLGRVRARARTRHLVEEGPTAWGTIINAIVVITTINTGAHVCILVYRCLAEMAPVISIYSYVLRMTTLHCLFLF